MFALHLRQLPQWCPEQGLATFEQSPKEKYLFSTAGFPKVRGLLSLRSPQLVLSGGASWLRQCEGQGDSCKGKVAAVAAVAAVKARWQLAPSCCCTFTLHAPHCTLLSAVCTQCASLSVTLHSAHSVYSITACHTAHWPLASQSFC